jgi:hypothetical protein
MMALGTLAAANKGKAQVFSLLSQEWNTEAVPLPEQFSLPSNP